MRIKISPFGASSIDNLAQLLEEIQTRLSERDYVVRDLLETLPNWFRKLGTVDGISELELRFGLKIPNALRLFYRFPALGCWLYANHDTDIFLESYQSSCQPHVVTWYYRPLIVLAEFPNSQLICAVQLDDDDPRIEWGDDGLAAPLDLPPCFFAQWLTRIARERLSEL